MSKLKMSQQKDYTEGSMDVIDFAKTFTDRVQHPGFKLVVAQCIDEIEQLRTVLDHTRQFLECCDNETCMCGGRIYIKADCTDHAPVSTYDRYVEEILNDIRAVLNLTPMENRDD